jgi:hypothetical protein
MACIGKTTLPQQSSGPTSTNSNQQGRSFFRTGSPFVPLRTSVPKERREGGNLLPVLRIQSHRLAHDNQSAASYHSVAQPSPRGIGACAVVACNRMKELFHDFDGFETNEMDLYLDLEGNETITEYSLSHKSLTSSPRLYTEHTCAIIAYSTSMEYRERNTEDGLGIVSMPGEMVPNYLTRWRRRRARTGRGSGCSYGRDRTW